jgi:thioredoxin-dependent peroxiredoxin
MPARGDMAPDFDAPTHDGKRLHLSALRGQRVVLYFYPEADTPGCTRESQAFRDNYAELQAQGIAVVGVSVDPVDKQCAFAEKYSLQFPLVADADKKVSRAYEVLNPSGRAQRVTFLIDDAGKITEVLKGIDAVEHVTRSRKALLGN